MLLAGSVALSRVVGYVREVVLADQLGAGALTDAYYAAFQIPDVLNYLLAGGALTVAFVPFYTRVRNERGDAAAWHLFEVVLGTTSAFAALATLALWGTADQLVPRIFHEYDPATQQMTVELTRILLPAQVFFVAGGVVRAVLMVEGRFLTHALAPIVYNLGIVSGGLITGTPEGFAWGALVGAFFGPFALPVLDLGRTVRIRPRIAPLAPDLRAYLYLALPLMLGLSLTTVDEWYDKYFGQSVGVGVVAVLGFARKLVQAPIAVIGQAIGVAALPTLTRLWAEGKNAELDRVLDGTLRAALGLGVLAAGFVYAFAGPLVELMYRHGAFTAEAAAQVASVLAVMSFAIPSWVAQQVAVRAFYAREEMWRAMGLGSAVAVGAIPLYLALGERAGAEGLAIAGAIAMLVNAIVTLGWARLRFGGPALGPLVGAFARAVLIAVLAVVAAKAVAPPGTGKLGALLELAVGGGVFALVAGLGVALVADEATRSRLLRLVRLLPGLRGRS